MARIVVSLGGSLLYDSSGRFDWQSASGLAGALREAKAQGTQLIVVVGGGKKAREYAGRARASNKGEFIADREAIKATRENAREMIKLLGNDAFGKVALSFDDAPAAMKQGRILVSGGMLEGLTTDSVSVLFAEMVKADAVVNLGDTEGIFTADPKKDRKAVPIKEMAHEDLVSLAARNDYRKAGTHFVFDLVASKLAARSNIDLRFADGRDARNAKAAIEGKKFRGTMVRN